MKTIRRIVVIGMVFLLTVIALITIDLANLDENVSAAYTPHGPIEIRGNSDFTAANGVTGGNGSESNPYIIEGWDINASSAIGIYIGTTNAYFIVRNCRVHDGISNNGIELRNVRNGRIENNEISINDRGIKIWSGSRDNIVSNNTIYSNRKDGILLTESSSHTIFNNSVYSNNNVGIHLWKSPSSTISNNRVYSNIDYGIEITLNSHFSTLANNSLSYNKHGIYLWVSSSNTIINNSIYSNINEGIYLYSNSNSNIISNNNISNNRYGMYIYRSASNTISNNDVSNNVMGLQIYGTSNSNAIFNNSIYSNNGNGMYLAGGGTTCVNNAIYANSIYSNNGYAIYLDSNCGGNKIYSNNFINNTDQAYDVNANIWDYGYDVGGNFWSVYNGSDEFSGPNQDQLGGDGIGDSPFVIDSNSKDNYPLMVPFPDTSAPQIQLMSPDNNSVIQPGVILDYYVSDRNLDTVNYSLDGGSEQTFLPPYNISTTSWLDGLHEVLIRANDTLNNTALKTFFFTIDSIKPIILLNTPENNSVILNGTTLDMTITDSNQIQVNYTINGGSNISLSDPYDVSTLGWLNGDYTVQINAVDVAGNLNSSWYFFTVNSTPPSFDSGTEDFITYTDDTFVIYANFTDNINVTSVTVHYKNETGSWISMNMNKEVEGGLGLIDHFTITSTDLEIFTLNDDSDWYFYFEATNGLQNSTHGSSLNYFTITVIDNISPIAAAGANQTEYEDRLVTVDASASTDNNGTSGLIYAWDWDTNNGIQVENTTISATHFYPDPGVYIVTLKVTDASGNWDIDTLTIIVKDVTSPNAEAGSIQVVDENTLVTVDAGGSTDNNGTAGLTYSWDWDANNGIQVENTTISATHFYPDPGVYIVTLNVTDASGNWDIDTMTVIVKDVTSPDVDAGFDQSVDEDTIVTIDAGSTMDNNGTSGLTYVWDWDSGDGITGDNNTITASHIYSEPGVYIVTLNVSDASGNWDTDTLIILVKDITSPDADAGSDQNVDEDTLVVVNASGSTDNNGTSGLSYAWDWDANDGINVDNSSISASHIYSEPGVYTVTLNVTDSSCNWNVVTITITVKDRLPPTADAGSDITVTQGTEIVFNGNNSTDNMGSADLYYIWDIYFDSDLVGIMMGSKNPTYTLNTPGTYTVTLNVTDDAGNSGFDTMTVTVLSDFDDDGIPDVDDEDNDNDGYLDEDDAFPFDTTEWLDTDNDKVGNNADPDDDNDGHYDDVDAYPLDSDLWKEEEDKPPSEMTWFWLLALVIIIVCIIVLMLVLMKRGGDTEEVSASPDEAVSFEGIAEDSQGVIKESKTSLSPLPPTTIPKQPTPPPPKKTPKLPPPPPPPPP